MVQDESKSPSLPTEEEDDSACSPIRPWFKPPGGSKYQMVIQVR